MVLAPLVIDSIYSYASMRDGEKLLIVALTVWRIVHGQIWISVSRYLTAKGAKRIVNKSIEFDQVDRERTWDDQVIFNSLVIYLLKLYVLGTNTLPFWRLDGMALVVLLHVGPVEFIYYWCGNFERTRYWEVGTEQNDMECVIRMKRKGQWIVLRRKFHIT
ncbi:hypothetical protein F2Q70_00008512 [Brassica cretica]|uniref:Uncharacterized protein n=1 Tax=Brassica cretica TaxID=69181 RepID=A0A8S9MGT0_BRACR|nr:hypothetical protein F2Q70_00008512 [Brassica cretica]